MRNLPSKKTLCQRLALDDSQGQDIRRILEKANSYLYDHEWRLALTKINDIIQGHGIEYLSCNPSNRRGIEYVNMGDPWTNTVMFDLDKQQFICGCWGYEVESQPSRFRD